MRQHTHKGWPQAGQWVIEQRDCGRNALLAGGVEHVFTIDDVGKLYVMSNKNGDTIELVAHEEEGHNARQV